MNANLTKAVVMGLLWAALAGVGTPGTEGAGPGDHALLVGRWDEGGRGDTLAVAVSGTVAYLGVGRNLKILDVSNPVEPALLARLELDPHVGFGQTIVGIALGGSHAYVATTAGLHIVDVSDPRAPIVVGFLVGGFNSSSELVASGDFLYLGTRILDVSNPADPTVASDLEYECRVPEISGSRLYCFGSVSQAPGSHGLLILDVSDPTRPVPLGSLPGVAGNHLAVQGSFAYIEGSSDLKVVDVSDPTAPSLVSVLPWNDLAHLSPPGGISVSGSYVYVVYRTVTPERSGLRIVDVSNPAMPVRMGDYTGHVAVGGVLMGSYFYLAAGYPSFRPAGLFIVDVSNPAAPIEAGSYVTPPGFAGSINLVGSHVWVADGKPAFRAVDVSNPASPVEVGALAVGGSDLWYAHHAVSGDLAYIAAGSGGLRILDISSPAAPVEVGYLYTPGSAASVAVSSSYAYVACGLRGLRVVDVSDPAAPFEVGFHVPTSPGSGRPLGSLDVEVAGSHAYVFSNGGMHIVDVSDPAAPIGVGGYGIDAQGRGITISEDGRYLYVDSYYPGGIVVLDLSDPVAPVQVGTVDLGYAVSANDLAVSGSLLFAAEWRALHVVDVSDPTAPVEIASYPVPGALRVAADGNHAYVTARYDGLYVIALDFDDDGIGNPTDDCPGSILTPTVGFGNCDSGVENTLFGDGCTIADRFAACDEGNGHHVQRMSCVASVLGRLRREAAISTYEQGRIHQCAAQTPPPDLVTTVSPGARVPDFIWARPLEASIDSGTFAYSYGLAVDRGGNVITAGLFYGTADFDSSPGTFNLTSNFSDAFVSKLDVNGEFVWARRIGGTGPAGGDYFNYVYAVSVAVDGAGNVLVHGGFAGRVDFDPGPGTYILDTGDDFDATFVVKLGADGNFIWARKTGGFSFVPEFFSGPSIALDESGDVYSTGLFHGTVDFDPGPDTYTLSADDQDLFVLKLDRNGQFIWARSLHAAPDPTGGFDQVYGGSIAVDGAGNVHTVGGLYGTVDFDPGPNEYLLTGVGMFVSKLDAAGRFVWAKDVDHPGYGTGYDLALDGAGNIYTSGSFPGGVDFDPGPGTYFIDEPGFRFIAKYDPAGEFVWATAEPVFENRMLVDIAADSSGNVYSIGTWEARDRTFCRKRDTNGNLLWTAGIGGTGDALPARIALGVGETVHVVGSLIGAADFDPGPGTFEITTGEFGASYLLKLGPPDSDGDGMPDEADACPDSITTATVVLGACDSGVPNTLLPSGCTIVDRLAVCDDAVNKGHQSGCVAKVLSELRSEGAVAASQQSRIKQCASPPRFQGSKGAKPASPPGKGGR